jgi:hypothetical protein
MHYSYVEIEYKATSFSPARTDLVVKLLTPPFHNNFRPMTECFGTNVYCILCSATNYLPGLFHNKAIKRPMRILRPLVGHVLTL